MEPTFTDAIVRAVPDSFDRAIRPSGSSGDIDVPLARAQHQAYVDTLSRCGVRIHRLEADEGHPDCCFVEDPAVVVGDVAVMCRMVPPSRRGEGAVVERALARFVSVLRMMPPAQMDGGDVLKAGGRVFVGVSERTNIEAVQQLRYSLSDRCQVTPVEVRNTLHLKSACTHVGGDVLLVDPTCVDPDAFAGLETLAVPAEERYAANCVALNGTVVVSSGFPRTRDLVAAAAQRMGAKVVELSMSEFRKAGGSLTCLSILL
jgi:dimethylargininase